jgi:DNA-binding NarL/FixJ family response regulator
MNTITTVIVDDEKFASDRLKRLLNGFPQIKILACISNSEKAIEFILKNNPDLVFLDVELEKNVSAFDILHKFQGNRYCPNIILVTGFPQYSIKAIKNGVFDYILKPVDIDELKDTINRFREFLSQKNSRIIKEFTMLSQRESEVLKYVLEGKSSSEIAELLYVSVNTVHTHRRNILRKTGTSSVVELFSLNHGMHD